eukprot:jgi/Ulvmu1/6166/UM028_0022.1
MAAHKQEMLRRAKAHVAQEQRQARQKIREAMQETQGAGQHDSTTVHAEEASVPTQAPEGMPSGSDGVDVALEIEDRLTEAHRQSRHNKIESDVANMLRAILAEKGLDVLRFVEDNLTPKQMLDAVTEHVPRNRAEVRQLLQKHNDQTLTLLLREVGLDWEPGPDPRADALARLSQHIHNFLL